MQQSFAPDVLPNLAVPRLALTPDAAALATRFSIRRIFYALSKGELAAKKHGRSTVIEVAELQRWLASLPTRRPADTAV